MSQQYPQDVVCTKTVPTSSLWLIKFSYFHSPNGVLVHSKDLASSDTWHGSRRSKLLGYMLNDIQGVEVMARQGLSGVRIENLRLVKLHDNNVLGKMKQDTDKGALACLSQR
jgi:hypothetical protein